MPAPSADLGEVQHGCVRPLRLLCIGWDLASGGAGAAQCELLTALDPSRFAPSVYYLRSRPDLIARFPALIPMTCMCAGRHSRPWRALTILPRLCAIALRHDAIFAMQDFAPTYISALVSRITRRPVIAWAHTVFGEVQSRAPWWYGAAGRWLYPHLTSVLAVSAGVAADLREAVPALSERVRVLHSPIDIARIRLLSTLPLPSECDRLFDKYTIVAVGRLVHLKGFDLLLAAFAELLLVQHEARLIIVGAGPERVPLETLAASLGIREYVCFTGVQENPYPFIKRANLLALTSRYEGLGLVILEALALGKPVVAFDCPWGPRELINDGKLGLLVPNGDQRALVIALQRVLADPAYEGTYHDDRLEVAARFDIHALIHDYEDHICSVTSRGR